MYIIWGGRLDPQTQTDYGHTSLSSVIINSQNVTSYHFPGHGVRLVQWIRSEAELQRHYSAMWLLLPVGSIFITALVVLLMVMFNRCPQMVAAVVTGILGTIIVFIILMSLDHKPIYA
ncbi:uncharacterized protein [Venturia canescens]|uniref:uncharacterized protein n=1 Tax=Venturia canescens TaxID=32260 RepID=UPI001C9BCBB9|nr:uncharacterized protein LOC122418240 [Venturia canescens]XP_043288308.1 uncharacterized protein LOC122418240 [Venturia canescens]